MLFQRDKLALRRLVEEAIYGVYSDGTYGGVLWSRAGLSLVSGVCRCIPTYKEFELSRNISAMAAL